MADSERYRRGRDRLEEIDGEAGRRVIESLQAVAPDLGRYIVEFAFGDVYSRPGLDLRQRQIATLSALTVLGGAEPQLEVHVNASLNVGLSPREIVETVIHTVPYAGFPRALNAMAVVRRVLEARGALPAEESADGGAGADGDIVPGR